MGSVSMGSPCVAVPAGRPTSSGGPFLSSSSTSAYTCHSKSKKLSASVRDDVPSFSYLSQSYLLLCNYNAILAWQYKQ